MLGPLAWTIVFVMIASLLGAVSVVPLAFIYLKPKAKEGLPINRLLAKFNRFYDKALRTVLHHILDTLLGEAMKQLDDPHGSNEEAAERSFALIFSVVRSYVKQEKFAT